MNDTASWNKEPDGIHCTWCGVPVMRIGDFRGTDLCKNCERGRKADKKDKGFCRGGCGRTLLWHALRCGDCQKANRWSSELILDAQRDNTVKKPRGKIALKEAERYYKDRGMNVPWDDKPTGGTWG